jgi:hypothetical protein
VPGSPIEFDPIRHVIHREFPMVYVRLARDWTDGGGAAHGAGDMVDVDAVTLAELEADGVVACADREADAAAGPFGG